MASSGWKYSLAISLFFFLVLDNLENPATALFVSAMKVVAR
jgi:hypothetical protein